MLLMDDEISYAEDIPYEAQLPTSAEQAATASLKERIGNRIYLLEDSRKRKLRDTMDTIESVNDDEDTEGTNADSTYRSNALLLHGPPISQLPTARVFAYATHFDARPIGLEWVDDETCVLVFTSRKNALQAWEALRRPGDLTTTAMQAEKSDEETVFSAPPIPLALYPIEDRINSALGTQKSTVLKETINIRWARTTDVKQRGARVRSEFYKKHGETAGKNGLFGLKDSKRRRYNEDVLGMGRRLDADLDSFLGGVDEDTSLNFSEHVVGEKRKRPRQEEARRQLDEELDSFLAQGDESGLPDERAFETLSHPEKPSLMDRTILPMPRRRGHVREARKEGENGRWLHNAERPRRRPSRNYEEGGPGMRAWREDEGRGSAVGGRRRRRPQKTQEELDRELEQFLGM